MIGEGKRLPVGGGLVLSRQHLLDLVDQMRVAMPAELHEARELISQQDNLLSQTQEEIAQLFTQAQEKIDARLQEEEIVKSAQKLADELQQSASEQARTMGREAEEQARARLDDAQEAAREQMREADLYAIRKFQQLDEQLEQFLQAIRAGVEALQKREEER